jgi:hypothetical protein
MTDANATRNLVAVVVLGLLGGILAFVEVPATNVPIITGIIGGLIGFMVPRKSANAR